MLFGSKDFSIRNPMCRARQICLALHSELNFRAADIGTDSVSPFRFVPVEDVRPRRRSDLTHALLLDLERKEKKCEYVNDGEKPFTFHNWQVTDSNGHTLNEEPGASRKVTRGTETGTDLLADRLAFENGRNRNRNGHTKKKLSHLNKCLILKIIFTPFEKSQN